LKQKDQNGEEQDRSDLLRALTGNCGCKDRETGEKTRRVVLASLGVLKDQCQFRRRNCALALATLLVLIVLLGPILWWAWEQLLCEDHLNSLVCQLHILLFFLGGAVMASVILAGWLRRKP